MNKELILKSDVLDIVFEHRNKAYGAYNLRKFYNNRLVKSLGLMLTSVVFLSAFSFLPKQKAVETKEEIPYTWANILPEKKEAPEKKEEPKPKEQVKPPTQAPAQQFTNPVIVDIKLLVKPLENLDSLALISNTTTKAKPGEVPIVRPPEPPVLPGDGPPVTVVPAKVDAVTPTEFAEVMPSYPGGMDALRKFLQRNLTNPRDMEEGEMVSVKVRFVVNYEGKLQSFVTVEDGGAEFNNEVVRVLRKMPEWIPGKTKGQNVSVYYTIPVKFVPAD